MNVGGDMLVFGVVCVVFFVIIVVLGNFVVWIIWLWLLVDVMLLIRVIWFLVLIDVKLLLLVLGFCVLLDVMLLMKKCLVDGVVFLEIIWLVFVIKEFCLEIVLDDIRFFIVFMGCILFCCIINGCLVNVMFWLFFLIFRVMLL